MLSYVRYKQLSSGRLTRPGLMQSPFAWGFGGAGPRETPLCGATWRLRRQVAPQGKGREGLRPSRSQLCNSPVNGRQPATAVVPLARRGTRFPTLLACRIGSRPASDIANCVERHTTERCAGTLLAPFVPNSYIGNQAVDGRRCALSPCPSCSSELRQGFA